MNIHKYTMHVTSGNSGKELGNAKGTSRIPHNTFHTVGMNSQLLHYATIDYSSSKISSINFCSGYPNGYMYRSIGLSKLDSP